jgi:hypothetical protein
MEITKMVGLSERERGEKRGREEERKRGREEERNRKREKEEGRIRNHIIWKHTHC